MSREKRIIFLVEFGCSIDPRSGFPSARSMMIDVIKFLSNIDQQDNLIDSCTLDFYQ